MRWLLLLIPAAAAVAGVEELLRRGYGWPIATTIIRPLLRRRKMEPAPIA